MANPCTTPCTATPTAATYPRPPTKSRPQPLRWQPPRKPTPAPNNKGPLGLRCCDPTGAWHPPPGAGPRASRLQPVTAQTSPRICPCPSSTPSHTPWCPACDLSPGLNRQPTSHAHHDPRTSRAVLSKAPASYTGISDESRRTVDCDTQA